MKNISLKFRQFLLKSKTLVFFLILLVLTSCSQKSPFVPSIDISNSYKLEWYNQHPQGDYNPILVPQDGTEAIVVEFVSNKPIPSDSVLALYLHKDRSLMGQREAGNPNDASERVHWASTPGSNSSWLSSALSSVK